MGVAELAAAVSLVGVAELAAAVSLVVAETIAVPLVGVAEAIAVPLVGVAELAAVVTMAVVAVIDIMDGGDRHLASAGRSSSNVVSGTGCGRQVSNLCWLISASMDCSKYYPLSTLLSTNSYIRLLATYSDRCSNLLQHLCAQICTNNPQQQPDIDTLVIVRLTNSYNVSSASIILIYLRPYWLCYHDSSS